MRAERLQQRAQQYAGPKPTTLAAWEEQAKADPRAVQKELSGPFGHIKDADVAALRSKVDLLVIERDKKVSFLPQV
jgi:hypothetical protein